MRTIAWRLLCALSFVLLSLHPLFADAEENRARATLRRMESIATAIEAYITDRNEAPKVTSMEALVPLLAPTYIRELPLRDGWETPLRYVRTGARSFRIVSAGSDRAFDEKSWDADAQTDDLAADAVYADGSFHRTWMSKFGPPLLRSNEEWQELARPLVEAEIEKMKGMTDAQSRNYLRTSSTLRDLQVLSVFIKAYKMKHGRYPAAKSMAEFETTLYPEFTSQVLTKDKWGNELRYVVANDGQSYRLISAGADAMFDEASWSKKGTLAFADEDAVLENGELIRQWSEETQPGLGPRAKLLPSARALLAQADAKLDAEDRAGALEAYIEAVKADRAAADLEAIRRYAPPAFGMGAPPPPPPPPAPNGESAPLPKTSADATAAHIAALRQFLDIHRGHADTERDLVVILPDAEATALMSDMVKRRPRDPEIYRLRSQILFRAGRYLDALADVEHATTLDPQNAEIFYIFGVSAYEVVAKQFEFSADQKRDLIRRGLAAFERAESLRADYFESMVYRNLLLREQAKLESDPAVQRKLIEEADAVRQRAVELVKARRGTPAPAESDVKPQPEPPPPSGSGPYRVGGAVKAPVALRRVEPVFPEAARKARISGIVIIEAVIDKHGRVTDAKVLKPLPFGLDQAALDAIKQWTFAPGTLNGEPVDVIFNLTVNMSVNER